MPALTIAHGAIWLIAALAWLGVLLRPWRLPEATWAVAGALLLGLTGLLSLEQVWAAVAAGTNVYLFLAGMMLLAELARQEGLFDWLAALAVRAARGSALRLFGLIYVVGVIVTMLLSNDATAVVLTPAVYAAARAARARPLPYLLVCAFIANAASFLLPISNPANLVVFGAALPPLQAWLARFALPAVVAILATFASLYLTQRSALGEAIARPTDLPVLGAGGRIAGGGIVLTTAALLAASAHGLALGAPTFVAGASTVLLTLLQQQRSPGPLLRGVSWSVLPLVAGLFVLVAGLAHGGVLLELQRLLQAASRHSALQASWMVGVLTALACNIANNLPVALVAGGSMVPGPVGRPLADVLLIAVDLGPNLSITGSLATILWVAALRREGEQISAGRFLRIGALVMLPALLGALAVAIWMG